MNNMTISPIQNNYVTKEAFDEFEGYTREGIDKIGEFSENINNGLIELTSTVNVMKRDMTAGFADLNGKFHILNDKLDGLDYKMGGMDYKIDKMKEDILAAINFNKL